MYIARFEIATLMGIEKHEIEGECAEDIFEEFQQIQDLEYLVQQGRIEGGSEGAEQLDKIEELLEKYEGGELEMEDIEDFDIILGDSVMRCVGIEED